MANPVTTITYPEPNDKMYFRRRRRDSDMLALAETAIDTTTFKDYRGYQPYVNLCRAFMAEFVGTAIFVFIGSLSGAQKVYSAFSHGFAIAFLLFAFGRISGGHFNPAVSIGQTLCGNIHWAKAIGYIFSQLFGAFIGALFLRTVTSPEGCPISYSDTNMCNTTGTPSYIFGGCIMPKSTWSESLVCEFLLTFILMQIILCTVGDASTQDERDRTLFAPLAIGFTIFANILAGEDISMAAMNPARAFGPAVAYSIFVNTTHEQWDCHYIYWIGPILGAVVSALLYKYLRH